MHERSEQPFPGAPVGGPKGLRRGRERSFQHGRPPAVERLGDRGVRMEELDAVGREVHGPEERRGDREGQDRRADVVPEAGEGQFLGSCPATGRRRRLVDPDRAPGTGQGDRCRQPVGPGSDDDRIDRATIGRHRSGPLGRSQSVVDVGATTAWVVAARSLVTASTLVSWRNRTANAWTVRSASYLVRSNRRSTSRRIRPTTGCRTAYVMRVEAATAMDCALGEGGQGRRQQEHAGREHDGQHDQDRDIRDRPADDPVDVVQAIALDREGDGDRHARVGDPDEDPRQERRAFQHRHEDRPLEVGDRGEGDGGDQPAHLDALETLRPPVPGQERDDAESDGQEEWEVQPARLRARCPRSPSQEPERTGSSRRWRSPSAPT